MVVFVCDVVCLCLVVVLWIVCIYPLRAMVQLQQKQHGFNIYIFMYTIAFNHNVTVASSADTYDLNLQDSAW